MAADLGYALVRFVADYEEAMKGMKKFLDAVEETQEQVKSKLQEMGESYNNLTEQINTATEAMENFQEQSERSSARDQQVFPIDELEKAVQAMNEFAEATEKVQKNTEQMADTMGENYEEMEEQVDNLSQSKEELGKQAEQTGSKMSRAFSGAMMGLAGLVPIVTGLFRAFFSLVKVGASLLATAFTGVISILRGVIGVMGRLASAGGKAFTFLISLAQKYIAVLLQIPRIIATIVREVVTLHRKVGHLLEELTTKFVFVQLDLRHTISQLMRIVTVFGGALAASSTALAHFEEQFVKVRRVMDATESQFRRLETSIRELSTEVVAGAGELAEMASVGARLGIHGVDDLERFTESMANLQMVTRITGEEGAAQFARIMRITGESLENVDRLASTIVHLGNQFAVFEDELLTLGMRLAGPASVLGMATDEIMAVGAAMGEAGVRAELGGSAMNRILLQMAESAHEGGELLQNFADIAGATAEEFRTFVQETPIRAVQEFLMGLGRMTEEGENVFAALEDVNLQQIRSRDVILRLVSAGDLLNRTVDEGSRAWTENTAMQEEAERRMNTLWAQIQLLIDEVIELGRALGEPLASNLREVVEAVREVVSSLRELDIEQYEAIVRFAALVAVIGGAIAALMGLARMVAVFVTAILLIARFMISMASLLVMIEAIRRVADALGVEFENLPDLMRQIWDAATDLANAIRDLWDSFREMPVVQDVMEDWERMLDRVQDAVEGGPVIEEDMTPGQMQVLFEDWEEPDPLGARLLAALSAPLEMGVDVLDTFRDAMDRTIKMMEEEGTIIDFDDPYMRAAQDFALSFGRFIKSALEFAFLDVPGFIIDAFLALREEESIVEVISGWFEKAMQGLEHVVFEWLEAPEHLEGWASAMDEVRDDIDFADAFEDKDVLESIQSWADMITGAVDTEDMGPWGELYLALVDFLGSAALLIIRFFQELGALIAESIDWDAVAEGVADFALEVGKLIGEGIIGSLAERFARDPEEFQKMMDMDPGEPLRDIFGAIHERLVGRKEEQEFRSEVLHEFYGATRDLIYATDEMTKSITDWRHHGLDIDAIDVWTDAPGTEDRKREIDEQSLQMLLRLTKAEAGKQSPEEQAMIMATVFSRMLSDEFPDTMEDVIHQQTAGGVWQFSPVGDETTAFHTMADAPLEAFSQEMESFVRWLQGEFDQYPDYPLFFFNPETAQSEWIRQFEDWGARFGGIEEFFGLDYEDFAHKFLLPQAEELQYTLGDLTEAIEDTIGTIQDIQRVGDTANEMQSGGILRGFGGGDQIPAMLEPGEAVVPARVVAGGLNAVEAWFAKHGVGYEEGGVVGGISSMLGVGGSGIGEMVEAVEGVEDGIVSEISSVGDRIEEWISAFSAWAEEAVPVIISGVGRIIDTMIDLADHFIEDEDIIDSMRGMRDSLMSVLNEISEITMDIFTEIEEEEPVPAGLARSPMADLGEPFPIIEDRLQGFALYLEKAIPALSGVSDALRLVSDIWSDEDVESFGDFIKELGSRAYKELSEGVGNFVEGIADFGSDFGEAMDLIFSGDVIAQSKGMALMFELVGEHVRNFATGLVMARNVIVDRFINDIIGQMGGFGDAIQGGVETFMETGSIFATLADIVMSAVTELDMFDELMEMIAEWWQEIIQILEPVVEVLYVLWQAVQPIVQLLADILAPVIEMVANVIIKVIEGIAKVWNALITVLDKIAFWTDLEKYKMEIERGTESLEDFSDELQDATREVPRFFRLAYREWQAGITGERTEATNIRGMDEHLELMSEQTYLLEEILGVGDGNGNGKGPLRSGGALDWFMVGGSSPGFMGGYTIIPYLAQGGLAMEETLAMVGESGPEAIIPLNRLHEFLGQGGGRSTEGEVIIIEGDVYGYEDFSRKVNEARDRKKTRRKKSKHGLR